MSLDTAATTIVAGWYPDPADAESLRWWDGVQWTATTRPRQPVAPPAAAGPGGSSGSGGSSGASAVEAFPPVPIRTEAALPPIDPYRPMDKRRDHDGYVAMAAAPARLTFTPTRTYTASVWWLATLPLWWTVLEVAFFLVLGQLYTPFLQLFARVIVVLVAAALTMHDRKVLLAEAHPTAASTWWFLLSPLAYLIARGVHVHRHLGRGWAPVVVYVVCWLAPVAAVLGMSYLVALLLALVP